MKMNVVEPSMTVKMSTLGTSKWACLAVGIALGITPAHVVVGLPMTAIQGRAQVTFTRTWSKTTTLQNCKLREDE